MTIKTLDCGKTYTKANNHKDVDLKGDWLVYIKIDGVRALRNSSGNVVSRDSKPLYNLNQLMFSDAEIYHKDWNTSVSLVRTESPTHIEQHMVYELTDGKVDPRLYLGTKTNPTNKWLDAMMEKYVALGHEGIVIRQGAKWVKVVPLKMADVLITGMKEGKGKNAGACGSISSHYGAVGSFVMQFDEAGKEIPDIYFRRYLWQHKNALVGTIMQVGYRETTVNNKLRFPKFVRFRFDKSEESLT